MDVASTDLIEELKPQEFPQVSVIVPVYNGEADLPDLLSCLAAQTYPQSQVEYVLIDNGSHDRTAAILQAATSESPQGITIRSVTEQIQSSYAARNAGMQAASGKIFAFTDVDCRPQPQWLQALIHPFQNSAIGVVAGKIVALPGKTLLEQHAERQEMLSQKHTLAHPFCPYGQTANLAVRRQVFEQVGLFRPYLTTGGDADLCWRIQQQTSWQLYDAKDATVQHRHRTSIADLRCQWKRYGCSNRYLHDLYGIQLMQFTLQDFLYRWSRWLLKELPHTLLRVGTRQAQWIELFHTPLNLLCMQARADGQRTAQLSPQAWTIASFPSSSLPMEGGNVPSAAQQVSQDYIDRRWKPPEPPLSQASN